MRWYSFTLVYTAVLVVSLICWAPAQVAAFASPPQAPASPVRSQADSSSGASFDVILSSGFLCFSRHAGFAASLEDLGLTSHIGRYVGTSSGALAASMLAAGMPAADVAAELSVRRRPISQCRPSATPWRGVLSTRSLLRRLEGILPETFEDLERPLAVGVCDVRTGEPRLVSEGPLAPAVCASLAVPKGMFSPVRLSDGRLYADGGTVDRTFVRKWREWGGAGHALVHLISDSSTYSERDGIPTVRDDLTVVASPRTRGRLWNLGDFEGELEETRTAVTEALRPMSRFSTRGRSQ